MSLLSPAVGQVTVTEKQMVIPTYEVGEADPNPYFFQGERYQGASRRVYPYPMVDNFSDNLIEKSYTAIILENAYVEICVIPEFGGKLYYARDKTNDYNFFYRNQVVKPALIGMTGAWTSGGVEWNVPHHHRASTFSMVDYKIEAGEDGSQTVWVGETELTDDMKWTVGLTLYPGKALVEVTARVMNTTPHQNSMLFWANAATHTNEDYQIIFPPQTQYATFHKKNQFSEWPISRQIYTRGDFRKGVDISLWKNHFISTSWFAWETQSNFVAGYDHGKKAGSVIFGNPHTNPGAKLWSWGNNEFGLLWNDILTDEDGSYVELMFGAFSDNQPDYSWLHPYETKESTMYFMPSRDIPSVKRVNQNGFLDLEVAGNQVTLGVYAAAQFDDAKVILRQGDKIVFSDQMNVGPENPYARTVGLKERTEELLSLSVVSSSGDTLIQYTALPKPNNPMPRAVKTPKWPEALSDADDLYFVGLRFEQFHEPQLDPMDYYLKALELEPDHLKANLRVGINYFRNRMYDQAEGYISKVIDRVTHDYTTAEDAEAIYYAGLIHFRKGNLEDAYKLLYRASWDHEWASPSHYQLSMIRLQSNDWQGALTHLEESLSTNQRHLDALSTKMTVLRKLGNTTEALKVGEQILKLHPLDLRAAFESAKLKNERFSNDELQRIAASGLHAYLDTATKYGAGGFYAEALEILELCQRSGDSSLNANPVVYYLSAYYLSELGEDERSRTALETAVSFPVDGCFPTRIETQKALEWALAQRDDAKTLLYLGNLLYEKQPDAAITLWKQAAEQKPAIAMVRRNLAFAHAHAREDYAKAAEEIQAAIEENSKDPLYFTEQDIYLSRMNAPVEDRLRLMQDHEDVVLSINHSASAYFRLLVLNKAYDKALELAEDYHFRKWEGDVERAYEYWVYAHLAKATEELQKDNLQGARSYLEKSLSRPTNIDVPIDGLDLIVHYYLGLIAEKTGNGKEAKAAFEKVVKGAGMDGDVKLYAAFAYQKLGREDEAEVLIDALEEEGEWLLKNKYVPDFFDPFAPFSRELTDDENASRAHYLLALGKFGRGEKAEAVRHAQKAVELNQSLIAITFRMEQED